MRSSSRFYLLVFAYFRNSIKHSWGYCCVWFASFIASSAVCSTFPVSLYTVCIVFSQDFTIQINTINFFFKFLFEFNLYLVCNDFCQVCCHSEINFLCSTFISPMIILTLSCTLVLISARSSCIWFDTSELLFLWIIFCLDFLISRCTEFRLRCSPQFFIFFIPFLVFHHVLQ